MKQSNIKIAVTGGIGSGKSTVCKIINSLGYPVYSCDDVYKSVLQDGHTVEEIKREFGKQVIKADGSLNRPALSAIVFADEEKLQLLNSITHPKIFKKLFELSAYEKGVVFYEVPVLFEGGYENMFDNVIVILRERSKRIRSVVERDKLSEEEVVNRLNRQYNYDFCVFTKYYVIHNDGNIGDLKREVANTLSKITIH